MSSALQQMHLLIATSGAFFLLMVQALIEQPGDLGK